MINKTFKQVLRDAILTWDDLSLTFLSEALVQYFLNDPESDSPMEPLLERMQDIIDVDLSIIKEFGSIYDILLSLSFSSKIFTQIAQLPETRHYVQITLRKFYDEIDFEYIDSIDFSEVAEKTSKKKQKQDKEDESYRVSKQSHKLSDFSQDRSFDDRRLEESCANRVDAGINDAVSETSNFNNSHRQDELFGVLLEKDEEKSAVHREVISKFSPKEIIFEFDVDSSTKTKLTNEGMIDDGLPKFASPSKQYDKINKI
jgi:hypothetical protein